MKHARNSFYRRFWSLIKVDVYKAGRELGSVRNQGSLYCFKRVDQECVQNLVESTRSRPEGLLLYRDAFKGPLSGFISMTRNGNDCLCIRIRQTLSLSPVSSSSCAMILYANALKRSTNSQYARSRPAFYFSS